MNNHEEEMALSELKYYLSQPCEIIPIKRYHMTRDAAMDFLEIMDDVGSYNGQECKLYLDKNDLDYYYIEIWDKKQRDNLYFENIKEEIDEEGERHAFYALRDYKIDRILKAINKGEVIITKEDLEKLY